MVKTATVTRVGDVVGSGKAEVSAVDVELHLVGGETVRYRLSAAAAAALATCGRPMAAP